MKMKFVSLKSIATISCATLLLSSHSIYAGNCVLKSYEIHRPGLFSTRTLTADATVQNRESYTVNVMASFDDVDGKTHSAQASELLCGGCQQSLYFDFHMTDDVNIKEGTFTIYCY